jgi:hypothetical protein
MKPSFILVSAAPGEPSILWIGKSGLRYRNIVHAKIDNPAYAYTPEPITKRPTDPTDLKEKATQVVSNNKNLITVVLLVLAGIVIVKLVK